MRNGTYVLPDCALRKYGVIELTVAGVTESAGRGGRAVSGGVFEAVSALM